MRPEAYPTLPAATLTPNVTTAALFLLHGRWVAACPGCGYQLAQARGQRRAERAARRRRCPVCRAG